MDASTGSRPDYKLLERAAAPHLNCALSVRPPTRRPPPERTAPRNSSKWSGINCLKRPPPLRSKTSYAPMTCAFWEDVSQNSLRYLINSAQRCGNRLGLALLGYDSIMTVRIKRTNRGTEIPFLHLRYTYLLHLTSDHSDCFYCTHWL